MIHSQNKGLRWEETVVAELRRRGFVHAERSPIGREQQGDILGVPGWLLEAKNHGTGTSRLGLWMDEAKKSSPSWRYAVITHRRGHSGADCAFAHLAFPSLLLLMQEAGYRG